MKISIFVILSFLIIFSAKALKGGFLYEFYQNPKKMMNQIPQKTGSLPPWEKTIRLESQNKMDLRNHIMGVVEGEEDKIEPGEHDSVDDFLGGPATITNLNQIEKQSLTEGKVAVAPWSDDYWPIYSGILGKRYLDPSFAYKDNWEDFFNYVMQRPAADIWSAFEPEEVGQLSPSEKYDLFVGDSAGSLTEKMWSEGRYYFEEHGEVETWMGICHGWAPASYMLDRPEKMVEVVAADGERKLTFYPSDIKALASLLWANTRVPTRFVGGRCNVKNPEQDENGRIIDESCYDNNPATFLLALVNKIGLEKKSFVFDATYDYQVWNQPITSYKMNYFNPQTLVENLPLDQAQIPREEYVRDLFKDYRSSRMETIVGVELRVDYLVETTPTGRVTDDESWDAVTSVFYFFDLELDKDNKIIGGEWYQNYHPDFIWTPDEGGRALSIADYAIDHSLSFDGLTPLPEEWQRVAPYASKYAQPLAAVVEGLIRLSKIVE
jgi:hypothetical protein